MKTNARGLALIQQFEGCRLAAYDDGVGVWTIGFGHTKGVKQGDTCTQEEALDWLREDLAEAEACVENSVSVPLTENEASALHSLVFNIGCGAFRKSTLLRKLNEADYDGASLEVLRWDMAGGRKLAGLTRRRVAERQLFEAG